MPANVPAITVNSTTANQTDPSMAKRVNSNSGPNRQTGLSSSSTQSSPCNSLLEGSAPVARN